MALRRNARAEEQRRAQRERLRTMARDISEAMAPLVRDGTVRVTQTAQGVTVEINASVLFASGEAALDPGAIKALRAVAAILATAEFPITVEGHTDDTPIATAQFPSNWELSVVRASSVVRLFADAGVAPRRMTATGFGQERPVTDNLTAEGRARNRRVTVLIDSPQQEAPQVIPLAQPTSTVSAQVPSYGG